MAEKYPVEITTRQLENGATFKCTTWVTPQLRLQRAIEEVLEQGETDKRHRPRHELAHRRTRPPDLHRAAARQQRRGLIVQNLEPPKELYDVYSERIRKLTYQDILGTILGWYTSQLWRRNPQLVIKPDGTSVLYDVDIALSSCVSAFEIDLLRSR